MNWNERESSLTEHWRPCLVDYIQTDRSTTRDPTNVQWLTVTERQHLQFIDIRMKDLVHEPNTRRLERVLIWKLDVDLPYATGERS